MRLLPSLLSASAGEVAAFRARLRDGFMTPSGTPADEAERAFEEMAARSSRI
jgi:hypothetical protein